MLKQDKVFYSSLIGILLNTVSFLMREHREVFLCPYQNPNLFDPKHFFWGQRIFPVGNTI